MSSASSASSPTWRTHAGWIGGGLSTFILAYVAYVHVLSASHRMSPDVREFRDGFGERDSLAPSWNVRSGGALKHAVHAGVLTVNGSGKAGDELAVVSAPRKFDDGVITLRFRVPAEDGIETFLGLEDIATGKTVRTTFVSGAAPFIHVEGDTSSPFRSMKTAEDAHVDAKAGEWHTLSLQFAPMYSMMTAALDGKPLASAKMGWPQGTSNRITFGVKLRGDVTSTTVEMDSVALDTMDWSAMRSFDENFSGEFLDVKRWLVQFPNSDFGKLDLRIDKGHGLAIDAGMQSLVVDPAFLFLVRTIPFPLKTLHMRAELWVEELEEASLFVGLMGASAWTAPDHDFDVGMSRHKKGPVQTYVAGGWSGDGSLNFDYGEEVTLPRKISLTIAYDASNATGSASIESKTSSNRYLDLKPLDIVAMRVGAIAHAPAAKVKLHVRTVSVEMR
jgi:hypothetical protein